MVVTLVSCLRTSDAEVEKALEKEGRPSVLQAFKTSRAYLEVPVGKCPMTIDGEVALFHREGHPLYPNIGGTYLKH